MISAHQVMMRNFHLKEGMLPHFNLFLLPLRIIHFLVTLSKKIKYQTLFIPKYEVFTFEYLAYETSCVTKKDNEDPLGENVKYGIKWLTNSNPLFIFDTPLKFVIIFC